MGRQINFYMSATDQSKMNDIIIAALPDLLVLKDEMDKQELEFLDTRELTDKARGPTTVLLARKMDAAKIVFSAPIKVIVKPYNIRNIVNQEVSPVVEYQLCRYRKNENNCKIIHRGRLYYHADFFVNNYTERVSKEPDFIKFAKKLFELFKKNLVYKKEQGNYYGEDALRCEKNGWQLTI